MVTGGAGGIGSAICRLFAAEGAKVTVADIDSGRGERVVEEVAEAGGEAFYVDLDVTKEEDWERAVAATGRTVRRVERSGKQRWGLQSRACSGYAIGNLESDNGGERHGSLFGEQTRHTGDEDVGWGDQS